MAAEFDNYKKRVARESAELRDSSKAEIARRILPALDEFELAIASARKGKDTEDPTLKGMEMIYSNLLSSLKSEGLKVIDTDGVYDPYKHEILMTVESDKKEGMIVEVVRKGYTLKDVLVRPAAVIIARKHDAEKETDQKNK